MSFLRTALAIYLRLACLVIGMGCLSAAAYSLWLVIQWRASWDTMATLAVVLAIAFIGVGVTFLRWAWWRGKSTSGPGSGLRGQS